MLFLAFANERKTRPFFAHPALSFSFFFVIIPLLYASIYELFLALWPRGDSFFVGIFPLTSRIQLEHLRLAEHWVHFGSLVMAHCFFGRNFRRKQYAIDGLRLSQGNRHSLNDG